MQGSAVSRASRQGQALAGLPDIFGNGRAQARQQFDAHQDELYKPIGQLRVELDFLKKRAGLVG